MVTNPEHHFEQVKAAGGDSVTFHVEACEEPWSAIALARSHDLGVGVAFNPETSVAGRRRRLARRRPRPLHEHPSRLLGPGVHAGRRCRGSASFARSSTSASSSRSTAASPRTTSGRCTRRAPTRSWRAPRSSATRTSAAPTTGSSAGSSPMSDAGWLARALELAERGRGLDCAEPDRRRGPRAGRRDRGRRAGTSARAGPHAEVVALEAAGERARGATLYVTLEPCAHHGRTPPCADALIEAGVARVVAAVGDPNPQTTAPASSGSARPGSRSTLPGGEVERLARVQNEDFRVWISQRRPFVVYKAAITLDGRVTVPGSRWVTGEESRRRVHELRGAGGRRGGRDGHRAGRRPAADRPRRRRRAAAAPARVRPRAAAGRLRARAPRQARSSEELDAAGRGGRAVAAPRRGPDAGHRLRRRPASSTSSCSSSRRRSPERARAGSGSCPSPWRSSIPRPSRWARTASSPAYLRELP